MKFHQQLAGLVAERAEVVFGLVGDGNLFFVDQFKRSGGRYVPALHEASALMMAAGYARVTGRVGVPTVTHGPGLTNVITALVETVKSHIPLLVIVGDTASISSYHPQDVEQRPLVVATGAGFVQVRASETLAVDFAAAYRQAQTESRPVVLNIPIDLMWVDVNPGPAAKPELSTVPAPSVSPGGEQVDRALGIIASARRPIVLAGRGAVGARESLVALAEALGAPLATTLLAKDLFRREPTDLGVYGTLATPVAQDVIADADCVIVFGASLNPYTTDHGHLVNGRAVVQVDTDPAAVGRHQRVEAVVMGDAARTAKTMLAMLRDVDHAPRSFNAGATLDRLRGWPRLTDRGTANEVDMQVAIVHLDQALPQRRSLVVDVGRFALHAIRMMHAAEAGSWLGSGAGFSAIGLGMGMAIGAGIGRPDQPSVLVTGDGGFLLGGLNEFRTAVEQDLDLICVVCNDRSYGAEHIQFVNRGMDADLSLLTPPNLAALAEALGGRGVTVRNNDELAGLGAVINGRDRPLLIDLRCDPDRVSDVD